MATGATSADGGSAFTFNGCYTRAVDAKGRFALPFRLRQAGPDQDDEKYMVSRGADGALSLHPKAVWIERIDRMREQAPSRELRDFLRRMMANAVEVPVDAQGRVTIAPERLAEYGITRKVTVMGMGSYMELYAPEAMAAYSPNPEADAAFDDEFFR